MDPPDHTLYRRITASWFLGQNVASFAERIRPLARRAIDRMAAQGNSCDFCHDVAHRYPLRVVMEILGTPEQDESLLLDLLQELFRSQDEVPNHDTKASRDPTRHVRRLLTAFKGVEAHFAPLLEERRKRPRDDMVSLISNAVIDGKPISQFEAVSYYLLIVAAGYHTTAAAMSGAIWGFVRESGSVPQGSLRHQPGAATRRRGGALDHPGAAHDAHRGRRHRHARTPHRQGRLADVVLFVR